MKLYLKDACYSILGAAKYRKYPRFMFDKKIYEFQCLPFSLSTSPRTFRKFMKPLCCWETRTASDDLPGRLVIVSLWAVGTDNSLQPRLSTVEELRIHHQDGKVPDNPCFLECIPEFTEYDNVSAIKKTSRVLTRITEKSTCKIHELSSVLGRMAHVSKVGIRTAPVY